MSRRVRARRAARNYKKTGPENVTVRVYSEPTPTMVPPSPTSGSSEDLAHLRRLAGVQGVEAAAKAFKLEELRRIARESGVTYLNPRARKVDIVEVLTR